MTWHSSREDGTVSHNVGKVVGNWEPQPLLTRSRMCERII